VLERPPATGRIDGPGDGAEPVRHLLIISRRAHDGSSEALRLGLVALEPLELGAHGGRLLQAPRGEEQRLELPAGVAGLACSVRTAAGRQGRPRAQPRAISVLIRSGRREGRPEASGDAPARREQISFPSRSRIALPSGPVDGRDHGQVRTSRQRRGHGAGDDPSPMRPPRHLLTAWPVALVASRRRS
jgi:hypothetical protein